MKALSISLFLLIGCLLVVHGQDKTYRKEKMNIMGASMQGFSTQVPFGDYKTRQYLITYLKENAKISEKRHFIEIKEASWKKRDDLAKVYAQVNGDSTQSRIWIGYAPEAGEELISAIEGQIESLPFMMHKYHLQALVKEAEDAATFLSKELKDTQRNGQRLTEDLEENAREKVRLEQALEQNAANKIQLEQNIEQNKNAQLEKTQALEDVKRQLELLRERLSRL